MNRRRGPPPNAAGGTAPRPAAEGLRPHSAGERRAALATAITIGVAAVAYLVIALLLHPVGDYYTESDFYGGYAAGARLIQQGRLDPARYPVVGPGFDVALAALGSLVRDLFTAAKLISVGSAIGALVCWAVLLRRRAGASLAFWPVAFVAVNPVFVRYAYSATTDMLATFLVSACACALVAGGRAVAVAGALAAAAALTRYNAIAIVPAGVAVLALLARDGRRRRGIEIVTFVAAFTIVAAPWFVHAARAGHVPGESLFRNFGFYANAGGTRNVQDAIVDANAPADSVDLGEALSQDPGGVAKWILLGVPRHLARDLVELVGWPAIPLVFAGLALAIRDGTWRTLAPVWIIGIGLFASLLPVFYSDRYSLPLAPVYLAWTGAAVTSRAWPRAIPPLARFLVAAGLLVASTIGSARVQRSVLEKIPLETRAAGHTLALASSPGDQVMSRKGHVGYYGGRETVDFPRVRTLAELAGHAGRRGARFLYFSWYEATLRPELAYLLDGTAGVPGLTPIFTSGEPPAVLYRIGPGFGREPDWAADDFQRSVRNARVLVKLLPDTAAWRQHTVLAVDALTNGRPGEALELAQRATRAHPADTLAWVVLGEALRVQARDREAVSAYRRALALDPDDVTAAVGLGRSLAALGDRQGAATAWRPFVGRVDDPESRATMAEVFEALGDSAALRALSRR